LGEIVHGLRDSVLLQISGRGADDGSAGGEPPRDEARILQPPDPDRQIPSFLHEIDIAVGQA
jgi:hypothetical protein